MRRFPILHPCSFLNLAPRQSCPRVFSPPCANRALGPGLRLLFWGKPQRTGKMSTSKQVRKCPAPLLSSNGSCQDYRQVWLFLLDQAECCPRGPPLSVSPLPRLFP